MTDTNDDVMTIQQYLAEGGILSSPGNAPPRYRAELLRLMATFVDSELAGAAGFADTINGAPGIKERIAAARIVLEKTDHAEKVMNIMGDFGADTARYANHHPWTARLARDADIGATRQGGDMRLSVFHYPLEGWHDAVTMNVLMGNAVGIQLDEFALISYQPLAEAFRAIQPVERRHAELGEEGLRKILADKDNASTVQTAVDYWWPRVAASFGAATSGRFDMLKRLGLRHRDNAALLADWQEKMSVLFADLGIKSAND